MKKAEAQGAKAYLMGIKCENNPHAADDVLQSAVNSAGHNSDSSSIVNDSSTGPVDNSDNRIDNSVGPVDNSQPVIPAVP